MGTVTDNLNTVMDKVMVEVQDAASTEKPAEVKAPKEEPKETTPESKETTVEKTETSEETFEVDASQEEINNALVFFRALGDPTKREQLLSEMAKGAGYDLNKKSEARQFEKDAKAILKEKLGDSYDLFSGDGLADAIEEIVKTRVDKITKPTLERIAEAEKAAQLDKATTAMDSFFKRNEIKEGERERVSSDLTKLMVKLPASPNISVEEYLDNLYFILNKGKQEATTVKRTVAKVKENAKETSRVSGDGGMDDTRVRRGSKSPSLDEAVQAAFRGEKLDF